MNTRTATLVFLMIAVLAVLPACKGNGKVKDQPEPPDTATTQADSQRATPPAAEDVEVTGGGFGDAEPDSAPLVAPTIEELNRQGVLQTIYFGFDEYDLGDEARRLLRENSNWLNDSPNRDYRIVVQGHCDERGTIDYNLALGEKRARAVREYLIDLGVDPARVRIVTYGEERPAARGHTEAAWAQNRRAVSVVEQ